MLIIVTTLIIITTQIALTTCPAQVSPQIPQQFGEAADEETEAPCCRHSPEDRHPAGQHWLCLAAEPSLLATPSNCLSGAQRIQTNKGT